MARNLHGGSGWKKCWIFFLALGMGVSFMGAAAAQPQSLYPIMVQTFLEIELLNPACWRYVTAFGIVEYENICSADSKVAMVKSDGKAATYAIPPRGKLVFIGGNTVHIFGKSRGTGQ